MNSLQSKLQAMLLGLSYPVPRILLCQELGVEVHLAAELREQGVMYWVRTRTDPRYQELEAILEVAEGCRGTWAAELKQWLGEIWRRTPPRYQLNEGMRFEQLG